MKKAASLDCNSVTQVLFLKMTITQYAEVLYMYTLFCQTEH